VAEYLGTRRNVVSQWETGHREPSYRDLITMADYYGVTTDWLLGREGAEKESPRVIKVKSLLRDYLRLKEGTLSRTTPGDRLRLCIAYLNEHDPEMFRYSRLAAQLLTGVEALAEILDGSIPCPQVVIQRFAYFAGLPELWFYHPEPRLEENLEAYRGVLIRLQGAGIGPAELESMVFRTGGTRSSRAKR
jgi:transcriptional regulator with XRE-family HTH domain